MWFKVDDKLHDHPKVRRCDDVAAIGLWTLAGSWASDNGTDGFVPESILRRWTPSWRRLASKLTEAQLWKAAQRVGEKGFEFVNWGSWNPTSDEALIPAERLRWRRAKALQRDRDLCERVCHRDGNRCRYCGVRVNWRDRKGATGGTYDHVNPDGDNSFDNVVVACRRCNGLKRDRTPAEAGMELLPPPGPDLAPARSDPDPAQDGSGSGSDPDSALRARDARDGTGQVGPGPDLAEAGSDPAGSGPGPRPDPDDDTTDPSTEGDQQ